MGDGGWLGRRGFRRDKPAGEREEPCGGKPGEEHREVARHGTPDGGVGLLTSHPRYSAHHLSAAYVLRYDWTGWPVAGTTFPPTCAAIARATASAWEADGLRLLTAHATAEKVQLLFSVRPQVSPVFCCMRAKGRLQQALRVAGTPVAFRRKVAFRSLGANTTADVEGYLRRQVQRKDFADPRFERTMRQFTVTCPEVVLAEPTASDSGRYWYNLHLVLVVAGRFRITEPAMLARVRDAAWAVAEATGSRIAVLALMPDHLHIALRGAIARSPEELALALQNGSARAAGCQLWQQGYYAGTFSEYDVGAIRRLVGES